MTDLRPIPKPTPHGDILRFIYEKDGRMTLEGEEDGQTDGFEKRREKQQDWGRIIDEKMSKEHINKEHRELKESKRKKKENTLIQDKTEGEKGSKRGVVGKSRMKGKKSVR